jgi:hypothetical protein
MSMPPVLVVAGLWLLFGGSHIALAVIRNRLVPRLGEMGFIALFYLVAATTFAALISYYAAHRFDGAPGLALGGVPVLRLGLMVLAVLGLMLAGSALTIYCRARCSVSRFARRAGSSASPAIRSSRGSASSPARTRCSPPTSSVRCSSAAWWR